MKEFFTSRKVLALVIGLVLMVGGGLFAGFPDVADQMVEVVAPIAVYIVSVGLTPNPAGVATVLKSTRFWALLAALLSAMVKQFVPDFPATEEQIVGFVTLFSSYIIGKGVADLILIKSKLSEIVPDFGAEPMSKKVVKK